MGREYMKRVRGRVLIWSAVMIERASNHGTGCVKGGVGSVSELKSVPCNEGLERCAGPTLEAPARRAKIDQQRVWTVYGARTWVVSISILP